MADLLAHRWMQTHDLLTHPRLSDATKQVIRNTVRNDFHGKDNSRVKATLSALGSPIKVTLLTTWDDLPLALKQLANEGVAANVRDAIDNYKLQALAKTSRWIALQVFLRSVQSTAQLEMRAIRSGVVRLILSLDVIDLLSMLSAAAVGIMASVLVGLLIYGILPGAAFLTVLSGGGALITASVGVMVGVGIVASVLTFAAFFVVIRGVRLVNRLLRQRGNTKEVSSEEELLVMQESSADMPAPLIGLEQLTITLDPAILAAHAEDITIAGAGGALVSQVRDTMIQVIDTWHRQGDTRGQLPADDDNIQLARDVKFITGKEYKGPESGVPVDLLRAHLRRHGVTDECRQNAVINLLRQSNGEVCLAHRFGGLLNGGWHADETVWLQGDVGRITVEFSHYAETQTTTMTLTTNVSAKSLSFHGAGEPTPVGELRGVFVLDKNLQLTMQEAALLITEDADFVKQLGANLLVGQSVSPMLTEIALLVDAEGVKYGLGRS